jgi:hypothetical protein
MLGKSLLLALAAAMMNTGAMAAVPKFNGSYVLQMTILCQGGLKVVHRPDGNVVSLSSLYRARLETDLGTASFNPTSKKASISAFTVFGETLQVQGASGAATNMHESTIAVTTSFANTATSFTVGSDVYRIIYGKVISGIVQNAAFQRFGGAAPDNHCAKQGTLFKK